MIALFVPAMSESFLLSSNRTFAEGLGALSPIGGPIVTLSSMFPSSYFSTTREILPYATLALFLTGIMQQRSRGGRSVALIAGPGGLNDRAPRIEFHRVTDNPFGRDYRVIRAAASPVELIRLWPTTQGQIEPHRAASHPKSKAISPFRTNIRP